MPLHNTRGAASATGFGFGAKGGNSITNYYDYMIVPYNPDPAAGSYSEFAFYNVVTNATTARVQVAPQYIGAGTKVMRFGNFLFIMYNMSGINYVVYNILTGAVTQTGLMGYGGNEGDVVKFGNNKIAGIVKQGTNLRVNTYSIDLTTGVVTFIAALSFSGVFTDTQVGTSSPQCAASINMDANAMFSSYNGWINYCAIMGYVSYNTTTAWGSFIINDAGTAISSNNIQVTGVNFSRPSAATGDTGRTCVMCFDGSQYSIFNQSSQGTIASGPFVDITNYAPIGIAGQQSFLALKYNAGNVQVKRLTTSGTIVSVTQFAANVNYDYQAFIGQMFADGAVVMIQNNTGTYGVPVLYRYNQYSENFGSAVTPVGLSTGRVNPSNQVVRVYNF